MRSAPLVLLAVLLLEAAAPASVTAPARRGEASLDGIWTITTDDPTVAEAVWLPIPVPGPWENVLGQEYDGAATYATEFDLPEDFPGQRFLLHFDAVATSAHVFVNGSLVATHDGAWTAFRADVTGVAQRGRNELVVMVDEKPGHETQGFLPVIAPHFGGIWQGVRLLGVGDVYLDDLSLLLAGDPERSLVLAEAPIAGTLAGASVFLEARIGGESFRAELHPGRNEVPVHGFEPFDVDRPHAYPVDLVLQDAGRRELDRVSARVAFRSLAANGRSFEWNGRPFVPRGILEWGYEPELLAPSPSADVVRRRVREARERGFNLIKFCLWVPSHAILDVLDREGMLAWVEYPTWHARIDAERKDALLREYDEFFRHDRNHPSVVLRSLTCETGHTAELDVIRALYDRAKERCPGALVEDDSAWIGWHRVHDFYDDHPYGNVDDWAERLDALNAHVDAREAKPLILGEAIAADTWLERGLYTEAHAAGRWWLPIAFEAQTRWEDAAARRFGRETVEALLPWSLRFAHAQRKDQIETFRLVVEGGGYVVSVARDFRLASMGLADVRDRWKFPAAEFAWHGDTMLVLGRDTPRALRAGTTVYLGLHVAHHGREALPAGSLTGTFGAGPAPARPLATPPLERGRVQRLHRLALAAGEAAQPEALELALALDADGGTVAKNAWTFWSLPRLPDAPPGDAAAAPLVAEALDEELLDRLLGGARVLLRASDAPLAFRAQNHWLLRGAPWFPPHPLRAKLPPELLLDLMVKDLHPRGLVPGEALFPHVDPIVAFWDTHDRRDVADWLVVFETRVGEGRLLVSALRDEGVAGTWAHEVLRRHLQDGPPPRAKLPADAIEAIRQQTRTRMLDLTSRPWQFRPDDALGAEFRPIEVGRHWEGQGHEGLDGHALYRLDLELPETWRGEPLYLLIDGADDAYWVSFDGTERGSGGDVAARASAFDEPATHRLAAAVEPGPHRLEIRVLDWHGAGGLHRPLRLSTRPRSPAAEFLNPRAPE